MQAVSASAVPGVRGKSAVPQEVWGQLMNPKDVGQWAAITVALAAGASAHFGVAQKARDAELDGAHTRQLLLAHVEEDKEVRLAAQREASSLRLEHVRDTEALRAHADATKERVIVLEQHHRQILDGQTRLERAIEGLTAEVAREVHR